MVILFGTHGVLSLCTLYLCLCLSSQFLGHEIVRRLGARRTLIASSAGYMALPLQCFFPSPGVMVGGSVVLGLCAGCMWTAQGVYTACSCSTNTAGRHNGIVFTGYQLGALLGYLLGSFLLHFGGHTLFFGTMLGMSVAAVCVMALLPQVDDSASRSAPAVTSARELILRMAKSVRDSISLRWLTPLFLWFGSSIGMYNIFFTTFVVGPHVGVENIGFVMTFLGLSNALFCPLVGWIADRYGRVHVIVMSLSILVAALSMLLVFYCKEWEHSFMTLCLISAVFGIADANLTIIPNTFITVVLLPSERPVAFGYMRTLRGLSGCVTIAFAYYVPPSLFLSGAIVLVIVAAVCYFWAEQRNTKDGKKSSVVGTLSQKVTVSVGNRIDQEGEMATLTESEVDEKV